MKSVILRYGVFLFLPVLLLTCEKTDQLQIDSLPEHLDLSGLAINMPIEFDYDFGHDSPRLLSDLMDDLVSEISEEGSDVQWVNIHSTAKSTTLRFGQGKPAGLDKKGGCSAEGWEMVGEGRCFNERCVRDRVETAYETKPSQGQCLDVRIDRGGVGVRVCSRLSEC